MKNHCHRCGCDTEIDLMLHLCDICLAERMLLDLQNSKRELLRQMWDKTERKRKLKHPQQQAPPEPPPPVRRIRQIDEI